MSVTITEEKKFEHALWFVLSHAKPSAEELHHLNDLFESAEKDIQAKALTSYKNYLDTIDNPMRLYSMQATPKMIGQMGMLTGIFIGLASLASPEFRKEIERVAREMAPDPKKILSFKDKAAEMKAKL